MRLHAERLENRFLMSADSPAAIIQAGVEGFSAGDELSVDNATVSQTIEQATIPKATSGNLQQFQSTAEFEAWLIEAATEQYGHLFGQPSYYHFRWNWNTIDTIALDAIAFDTDIFAPVVRASTTSILGNVNSATNVQVAGVDEADLVETDGEYLYIISGQELVIVQAGIGDDLNVMSRVHLDERPVGMYLSGNRLALVSSSTMEFGNLFPLGRPLIWGGAPLLTDVFGFPAEEPDPPTTTVTLLDITDRAAPTLVQKTEMEGQLVTSRTVDGQLRLVLTNDLRLPMPIARPLQETDRAAQFKPKAEPIGEASQLRLAVDQAWLLPTDEAPWVYETREEYLARVREDFLAAAGPQIRRLSLDGSVISESPLLNATEIYLPESHLNSHAVTVATFDLTSNATGPAATSTIMTSGQPQVYVDEDSIYVFAEQAPTYQQSELGIWIMPATSVWKFQIDPESHGIELVATGEFDGAILNQFAADKQDGRLRVVTQANWSSTGQSVHVLEQDGDELNVVGSLTGIATNEQLYSVRFIDDNVFFVTFRQTDPLFVVDLSDPQNPQLRGELHIPGFSDYLQPIDEHHLLAVGRDADENTGAFEELQVSIFDISDLTDPQLLHRYTFEGGRSTATPVSGNRWVRGDGDHHAVSYFASEQIFALPIYTPEDIQWWIDGDRDAAQFEAGQGGLQVFRIDAEAGFVPLGLIEHDTLVERSLQIGDHLFAISSGTVTVHELTNPNVRLGELDITAEASREAVSLRMYEPPVETTASETSERGNRPAPRADWMPLASERIQFKPPERTAAFAGITYSRPVGDESIHAIAMEAASAVESSTKSTADDRPAPGADWMPLSLGRVHFKPPVRPAAFDSIPHSRPLDDDLVHAIAIDTASLVDSPAASTVDPSKVDFASDDVDDADQPGGQLLARRGALRPLAARLVS
jgi:uncharacterized secreted protein with C-terminal beta-propeller domain